LEDSFYALVKSRRSIRRYRPEPVPQAVLARLLEAAIWAPSAHNRQPWRFVVLTDPACKEHLAREMGNRLRVDRSRDGVLPELIDQDVSRSYARITDAPAVILVCLTMAEMDHYPDPLRRQAEYMMAVQSTAMAVQNLLLAAYVEGVGACWMCAPLFCPEVVRDALSLPGDWEPQALITLGLPANAGKPPRRYPLESRVRWA